MSYDIVHQAVSYFPRFAFTDRKNRDNIFLLLPIIKCIKGYFLEKLENPFLHLHGSLVCESNCKDTLKKFLPRSQPGIHDKLDVSLRKSVGFP